MIRTVNPQANRQKIGFGILTAVVLVAVGFLVVRPAIPTTTVGSVDTLGNFECVANRNVTNRYDNVKARMTGVANGRQHWEISTPRSDGSFSTETLTVNPRFTTCGYAN